MKLRLREALVVVLLCSSCSPLLYVDVADRSELLTTARMRGLADLTAQCLQLEPNSRVGRQSLLHVAWSGNVDIEGILRRANAENLDSLFRDAWGTRIEVWVDNEGSVLLISAGPDHDFESSEDNVTERYPILEK